MSHAHVKSVLKCYRHQPTTLPVGATRAVNGQHVMKVYMPCLHNP